MKLDVGCGYRPTGDVNVDINSPYADMICDAAYLPFKDEAFTEVFSGDVIEHCSDPAKMLEEMLRVGRKVTFTTDDIHWPGRVFHYLFRRGQCMGKEHCMAWTRRYMENWLRLMCVYDCRVTKTIRTPSPSAHWPKRAFYWLVERPLSAVGIKPTIKVEIG